MVEVNGTNLHVEAYGPAGAPTLFFIHGHGAGSLHFTHYQARRLSEDCRLITMDQRGVLRSDPHSPGDPIDVPVLLADFEELREQHRIARWAILGHSAGGHYAVDYATRYPDSVSAVIFDCPLWDFDLADRYRLPRFAQLYEESGDHERATVCRNLAGSPRRLTADDCTYQLAFGLGERFHQTYFHDPDMARAFQAVGEQASLPSEMWERGNSHGALLPTLYNSQLDLLKDLKSPSLLIHGIGDLAAPPAAIDAYRANVPVGRVVTFEQSGHFPHAEEPDRYAELIRTFVHEHDSAA